MVMVMSPRRRQYRLGKLDAIPEGEGRVFRVDQTPVAVFRGRSGELFATQAVCPHGRGQLADGIVGGRTLICPLHGYRFDLATGQPIGHECPPLTTYPVALSADGGILICLDE